MTRATATTSPGPPATRRSDLNDVLEQETKGQLEQDLVVNDHLRLVLSLLRRAASAR